MTIDGHETLGLSPREEEAPDNGIFAAQWRSTLLWFGSLIVSATVAYFGNQAVLSGHVGDIKEQANAARISEGTHYQELKSMLSDMKTDIRELRALEMARIPK